MIDEILRRHGVAGPATLFARQGAGAFTWSAGAFVIKIARAGASDELRREAVAGPAARAAGVRTPALVADGDGAYNIWERVAAEPLGDRMSSIAATTGAPCCASASSATRGRTCTRCRTLNDWGDAAWGDPASDFGSIPLQ